MADPRDDLKNELRSHLELAATKVGNVITALDASVVETALGAATGELREAVLLVDGLQAMRRQVPGLEASERKLDLQTAYENWRAELGRAHTRILAVIDAIDNPPSMP